ncbi:MAG TPA: sigma factor [Gemmatimonadales bacterium]
MNDKREAFEAAALPFMRALYNTALRLTREPPDAADLVQETLLRAYRTFENFTPGSNCKAWLFTILYSIFTNQYHQAKRRPGMESVEAGFLFSGRGAGQCRAERSLGGDRGADPDCGDQVVQDRPFPG